MNASYADVGVTAKDPGIGISAYSAHSPQAPSWGFGFGGMAGCEGVQCDECWNWSSECAGQSTGGKPLSAALSGLPDGKDTVEISVENATTESATASGVVNVDSTPPHSLKLSGLPPGAEVGKGTYKLKFEATDGTSVESSGIASLSATLDGKSIGVPAAKCAPGPCTAATEWSLVGSELAAGRHQLVLSATDAAGNLAQERITLLAHPAASVPVGPGSVNPYTGEYRLQATDVSLGNGLTVTRAFGSRHTFAGVEGPLGAQWAIGLGGQESLVKQADGSMLLTAANGEQTIFSVKEGGFTSPPGDANVTLSSTPCEAGQTEYMLKNAAANTTTCFREPPGGGGELFVPSIVKGAVATETVTFAYETAEVPSGSGKKVTRPVEALAPVPAGVSCSPELKAGCRALTFNYATSTTATGEHPSEWGDYQGSLTRVYFNGWDPISKEMKKEVAVAQYAYDKQGRLRAEWDPRVSPALKTLYGYDEEGRVVSISPPGQESWAFVYGSATNDPNPGRILKVTRAPASAPVSSGEAPVNTTAPVLSGSGIEGVRLSVSNGSWSNSPVLYAYRWMDLSEGNVPIPGADNANYTPTGRRVGHWVYADVIAIGGGGATVANSSYVVVGKGEEGPATVGASTFASVFNSGVATDAAGDVLVATSSQNHVDVYSPEGKLVREVGSSASGNPAIKGTAGVAVDPAGDIWVSDREDNRLEEFNAAGIYLRSVGSVGTGNGNLKTPEGIATDGSGDVWVADTNNNRIEEFTAEGEFVKTVTGTGSSLLRAPDAVAIDASGHVWVADTGNNRIEEFTTGGSYINAFGSEGTGELQFKKPAGIAIGPNGDIWVSDTANGRYEVLSSSGSYVGQYLLHGKGTDPTCVAFFGASVYETAGVEVTKSFMHNASAGDAALQPAQPGSTVEYGAPVLATGLPALTPVELARWGQKDEPVEGIAVFPPDEPQRWPASEYKRATIEYLDNQGRTVNTETPGSAVSSAEYNETNDVVRTLTPDNRATALNEGAKSAEVAKLLDTEGTYNSEGNELLSTLGPRHLIKLANGKEAQARSHTLDSYDEGAPSEGGPYTLVTKVTQGAQIEGEAEQDVRTVTTSYSGQSNLGWKLRKPTSVTADPSGVKITHTTVYEEATGNVLETWMPKSTGAGSPHDAKTVYYSAGANSSYPSCGEHPGWAGMACETLPGKQPETAGLPALPVSTVTYNMWGEPETATSTSGTSTRTSKNTYDSAGRPLTSETTSGVGTALPKVSNEYNSKTGALVKVSTGSGETLKSIVSEYNTLGETTSYTDADGGVSRFEYEPEGDGRLTKASDAKGSQTYSYDSTTGALKEIVDSAAKTFTAGYDVEGNLVKEGYPNGMTATYTYNPAGDTTGLVYKKETNCTEKCEWFTDSEIPTIHGQWASQTSSLGKELYSYDTTGRLTETQDTPAGKGCMTRRYVYDEDTNRASLTSYQPNAKGECSTETSAVEKHGYDEADRLTDAGIAYNAFGNIEKLPAGDAGGSELKSTFYVDNQTATQEQAGETIGYNLDPADRTREVVSTGKVVATETLHYDGPGSSPAWTSEPSGKWTRNIEGAGGLAAIQHEGEAPVLQLTNLHGDIIATAADSETSKELASTVAEPSEFGVPATETPPKYEWLGAHELPTMLPSGVIAMGARSYVPQLGRFLQTDPVPGGSANAYAYTEGNPVNETDLTGKYDIKLSATLIAAENKESEEEAARGAKAAAAERSAREEAERRATEARVEAEAYAAMKENEWVGLSSGYESLEGEEEYWEEEGEYEYISDYHNGDLSHEEMHVEPGLLIQSLSGAEGRGENATTQADSTVPLCNSEGPCVRDVSGHSKRRHKGHHCDLEFQACVKCPPGYEEIPIGGEKCFPSAPPDSGGNSKTKKEWWEPPLIISGYRQR